MKPINIMSKLNESYVFTGSDYNKFLSSVKKNVTNILKDADEILGYSLHKDKKLCNDLSESIAKIIDERLDDRFNNYGD